MQDIPIPVKGKFSRGIYRTHTVLERETPLRDAYNPAGPIETFQECIVRESFTCGAIRLYW